jgi:hypothetical protein
MCENLNRTIKARGCTMVLFLRPKREFRLTPLTSFAESLLRTISPLRHSLIPASGWFSASARSGKANGGESNMVRFNILAAIGSALLLVGCNPTPVTIAPPRIAQGGLRAREPIAGAALQLG